MNEIECVRRLRDLRWSLGVVCPRCRYDRVRSHAAPDRLGRRKYLCLRCERTFSDLTGTVFAHSRLPLSIWFRCAKRMLSEEPTCEELAQHLGVKTATAWRLRKELRRLLLHDEYRQLFEEGWS